MEYNGGKLLKYSLEIKAKGTNNAILAGLWEESGRNVDIGLYPYIKDASTAPPPSLYSRASRNKAFFIPFANFVKS